MSDGMEAPAIYPVLNATIGFILTDGRMQGASLMHDHFLSLQEKPHVDPDLIFIIFILIITM